MNHNHSQLDLGSYAESLNTVPVCRQQVADTDWFPAVDVSDAGDEYLFEFDLPGLAREEIQISLDEDALFLVGTRMSSPSAGTRLRAERPVGAFVRRLVLPPDSCRDALYATLHEGVLKLHLPKNSSPKEKEESHGIPPVESNHERTQHEYEHTAS